MSRTTKPTTSATSKRSRVTGDRADETPVAGNAVPEPTDRIPRDPLSLRLSRSMYVQVPFFMVFAALAAAGVKKALAWMDRPPDPSAAITEYASGAPATLVGDADGFTVVFPIAPERSVEPTLVAGRLIDLISYQTPENDEAVFSAGFAELVNPAVAQRDPDGTLDAAVRGAAAEADGQVVGKRRLTLPAGEAVDYLLSLDAGFVKGRVLVTSSRVYDLEIRSASENPLGHTRFFNSFKEL